MPEPIASTFVEIKYDQVTKSQQAIDKMGVGFNKAASDIESKMQRISRAFGALGGVIAGIGIAKFGSDIIGASTRMDSLNRSLITTEGSAQKAQARMKEFVQVAKDPGLGLTQLTKGYIQLKSVNIESELAIKSIRGIANAIALVGGGKEELERVTRQFVQMQGKGKVMAEDLVVIAESLPQIRKLAEQAFGTANTEALQKMGITGKQFLAGITVELEKMPKAADSAKNAQDNFTDALERFRAKLGDQILPTVTKFLNGLTNLMSKFEAMPASTQKLMGTAVVGGAGLLGLSATLLSIVSTIGLIKTGLGGLGAVNVASAGAGVAGSATGIATSAGAGAAGASLLTKAGVVAVYIAGAAGAFWAGSKLGGALFGKDYDSKGNLITKEKPLTDTESNKWQSMVDKFNASYFGTSTSTPTGTQIPRTIPANESVMALATPEDIKALKEAGLNLPTKEEVADKAKKDSEIYWKNWFDYAEAIAKQGYQIKTNQPSPIFMPDIPSRGVGNIGYNEIPSMAGGVPQTYYGADIDRKGLIAALGLGGEISKGMQSVMESKMGVYQIEKDASLFSAKEKIHSLADEFDGVTEEMSGGIEKTSIAWDDFAMDMYRSIGGMTNMASALNGLIQGYLNIQAKRQAFKESEMRLETMVNAGEISPEVALLMQMEKSSIGATHNLAVRKLHEMGVEGYAEGGSFIVTQPTLFMAGEAGRERVDVTPNSKMGSSGMGGVSFGDVNVYISGDADVPKIKQSILTAINALVQEGRISKAVFS